MNIECATRTIKTPNGVITRLGWVHEYTQGSGETALIASMKSLLNVLDPLTSGSMRHGLAIKLFTSVRRHPIPTW